MALKSKKIAKITAFGCQMNGRDSETIAGFLENAGYVIDELAETPDLAIFITCCVREHAEQRAFGNLGYMKNLKEKHPDMLIGVCGCMVQQKSVLDDIRDKMSFIDLVFGTHNIHRLPELLSRLNEGERVIEVFEEPDDIYENLPVIRASNTKASVNIMYGCDNYCTYCIVPYVRGRERSRSIEAIIDECTGLGRAGYKEIMLLGQNVNSYGKTLETKVDFSDLLMKVNEVAGIARVRYMTSHPKDLSLKLIETVARYSKICENFHLPLQAGSNRILGKMNRGYTSEQYLNIVENIRKAIPDAVITTDIMVGFPGETDEDFNDTLSVVKEASFDSAFTFIYSPREGTKAADMDDQISLEVKKHRINTLIEIQKNIGYLRNRLDIGKIMEVMVDGVSEKDASISSGRTRGNKQVHWTPKKEYMPGEIVHIKIEDAKPWTLLGSEQV